MQNLFLILLLVAFVACASAQLLSYGGYYGGRLAYPYTSAAYPYSRGLYGGYVAPLTDGTASMVATVRTGGWGWK
ncbi:hypothetical protein CEXT_466761 [Caerostris extrusa]|uniref:Uncharacterized protein n=1 Tax=Caerostris extrusa TaxID=172846 RepID=A0AAV4WUF7_CAEEX|nr:hypothetical protein CEXT_466761 [Caerostris extrusa]